MVVQCLWVSVCSSVCCQYFKAAIICPLYTVLHIKPTVSVSSAESITTGLGSTRVNGMSYWTDFCVYNKVIMVRLTLDPGVIHWVSLLQQHYESPYFSSTMSLLTSAALWVSLLQQHYTDSERLHFWSLYSSGFLEMFRWQNKSRSN